MFIKEKKKASQIIIQVSAPLQFPEVTCKAEPRLQSWELSQSQRPNPHLSPA